MTLELILAGIALPMIGWVLKTLLDLRTGMTEIRTTLIGVDGQNGIRSVVKGMEEDLAQHERRLTILEHPGLS